MSIVAIAYVPEGIAVAADSRSSDFDKDGNFFIGRDDNMKIVFIEKYNVFFTLCGCPKFTNKQKEDVVFQDFIINEFIGDFEDYIGNNTPVLKIMINHFKNYICEFSSSTECDIYIAGFDIYEKKPYVVKYTKKPDSLFDENQEWCLKSLNNVPVDCQNIINKEWNIPTIGFDVAGVSTFISKISDNIFVIGNKEIEINEYTSLEEAQNICRYVVDYTIKNLKDCGYAPVCGGPITSFVIPTSKE